MLWHHDRKRMMSDMWRGCCSNTDSVNFGLMTLPDDFPLDLSNGLLWWAAYLISWKPFFKAIVGVWEYKHRCLNRWLGHSAANMLYVGISCLYGSFTYLSFLSALREQPRTLELHKNEVLLIGYMTFLAGLGIKIYFYLKHGLLNVLGGAYFKAFEKDQSEVSYKDVYYHPVGTASVLIYGGSALLQASIGGILLTILLGLAYLLASFTEKYHLEHHGIVTIPGCSVKGYFRTKTE